ncbi:hypothetical protein HDV01_006610 [Terramyces sp. JEL0728]|nr:hypothetical protein HDV01_006610 [Terramyces sp. JEL0728]
MLKSENFQSIKKKSIVEDYKSVSFFLQVYAFTFLVVLIGLILVVLLDDGTEFGLFLCNCIVIGVLCCSSIHSYQITEIVQRLDGIVVPRANSKSLTATKTDNLQSILVKSDPGSGSDSVSMEKSMERKKSKLVRFGEENTVH